MRKLRISRALHPNSLQRSTPWAAARWTAAALALAAAGLGLGPGLAHAQAPAGSANAQSVVEAAVRAELSASQTDKSVWCYRDHDTVPGKDALYLECETPAGSLRRMIQLNGHPLTPDQKAAEDDRVNKFINSPDEQAKARKNGQHDDEQAAEMLRMLPRAFVWTVVSESPEAVTLSYAPNPAFNPPDMQSRVMSAMAGEMVVARKGNRIRSLKGKLSRDIKIGYGILGKLDEGGSFDVERREIAPGRWQITATHVHIGGHALLFKTIGSQEDEVKTEWKPSPAKDLREAQALLKE